MKPPTTRIHYDDPLALWAADLHTEVIGALSPNAVGAIVDAVLVGAVATTMAAAVTTATVAEGGVAMTTTIAASAASHSALKVAAIGLAATLAAGGTAAVTGNLPDGAQRFTADAAAHIGLTLPSPDASVLGSLDLAVGDLVTVAGAGKVGVRLEGGALVITGIESEDGFSASIVSQTQDAVLVEFRSATETATVLVTQVNGTIVSDVEFDAAADTGAEYEGDAGADAEAEAEAEAKAEAELEIQIGG